MKIAHDKTRDHFQLPIETKTPNGEDRGELELNFS